MIFFTHLITEKVVKNLSSHATSLMKISEIDRYGQSQVGVVRWCDGPGKTSSAGASYNLGESRARAYCACSRCGWGVVWTFFLSSILSSLSPSLWETVRYRLKYCLKGPLNPKQPTKVRYESSDCVFTESLFMVYHVQDLSSIKDQGHSDG